MQSRDDQAPRAQRGHCDLGAGELYWETQQRGWALDDVSLTLMQPKGGTIEDQFPVIRIGDEYFTMSLRMMKAVW